MTALVGKFLNVRQAGYLYQGKRIENTLSTSLAGAIGVVTFPILTKHKDDLSVFNREALSTLKNITALSFPILITVAVFSKEIIVFLFGEKWIASGFYLEMLTFAGLFLIIETLIRNFIKALCQVKKLMYATIIKRLLGIAILILSMIIKPDFIVFGYIISSFIGYVINSILFIKLSRIKVFSLITATLSSFVFCIAYYILFKALTFFGFKLLFKVLISVAILALYYFIALPLTGINILSIIKRK
jgi:O-antigen/teichoic acid export membrane protein